jgi:hypothetical protein
VSVKVRQDVVLKIANGISKVCVDNEANTLEVVEAMALSLAGAFQEFNNVHGAAAVDELGKAMSIAATVERFAEAFGGSISMLDRHKRGNN